MELTFFVYYFFIGSKIENNKISGIRHNPALSGLEQREIAGWFKPVSDFSAQYAPYVPIYIPQSTNVIEIAEGETKYLITQRVTVDAIENSYYIKVNTWMHNVFIDLSSIELVF
jgi:hypothetical protein